MSLYRSSMPVVPYGIRVVDSLVASVLSGIVVSYGHGGKLGTEVVNTHFFFIPDKQIY